MSDTYASYAATAAELSGALELRQIPRGAIFEFDREVEFDSTTIPAGTDFIFDFHRPYDVPEICARIAEFPEMGCQIIRTAGMTMDNVTLLSWQIPSALWVSVPTLLMVAALALAAWFGGNRSGEGWARYSFAERISLGALLVVYGAFLTKAGFYSWGVVGTVPMALGIGTLVIAHADWTFESSRARRK